MGGQGKGGVMKDERDCPLYLHTYRLCTQLLWTLGWDVGERRAMVDKFI